MKRYYFFKLFFLLLSVSWLSGCTLFSPVKEADNIYLLETTPPRIPVKYSRSRILLVMQPETVPAYNTTNMAYATMPYQIAYYAKSRWAETPSEMLYPLVVQTLENTNAFHAVVTPPYSGRYDYVLNMQILKLEHDYTLRPPAAHLVVRAILTRAGTGQIIEIHQFCATHPIKTATPYGGVWAANKATAKFLAELAHWVTQTLR